MDNSRWAQARLSPVRATADHVVPKADGGFDGPGNLLAMRAACNTAKAHNPPTDHQLAELTRVNALLGWAVPEPQRSAA